MSEISPLAAEWDGVPKNWYSVYQWQRCAAVGHTEEVASLIEHTFEQIELATDGLRERFRLPDHRGLVTIAEGTESIVNEKRIVRALYNAKRLPLLGRILDYEAPLRATRDAEHGDVDLISVSRGDCLCLEAKKPGSNESLLKPMLQAYTYARLLWRHRRRFLDEYELDSQTRLTPGVLTFPDAVSGQMLDNLHQYPRLSRLIVRLSEDLEARGLGPLRFFLIRATGDEVKNAFTLTPYTTDAGVVENRPELGQPFPFVPMEVGVCD